MFHFDEGLFLTSLGLAIDVPRRQRWGFVSHAHADHIAPHARTMATPATLAIVHRRLHQSLTFDSLEFGKSITRDGIQLTALPAGHILGAAMLRVESNDASYLITGDFCLEPSLTAGSADPQPADVLIMETTFGSPDFKMPPRDVTIAKLVETVSRLLRLGKTPLIRTYVVGKSQELLKILTDADIPVAVHPEVANYAEIYQDFGCDLGEFVVCSKDPPADHALIFPPAAARQSRSHRLPESCQAIAVTGWAAVENHPRVRHADYRFPLSDHADYDALLETVARVQPQRIYCYHGYRQFVDDLRSRGHDAQWLSECQSIR